jgi:phosphoribosylformimino-5-aminoimidazole carboxamide ribotide isomerase
MEIFPAVDVYEGKVVRLEKGDYTQCKVYSDKPLEVVKRWQDEGARWVHVVDLEGAKTGRIKNWELLESLLSACKVSVQFGGGVRKAEDVERLMEMGVSRVVVGTKALEPRFLANVTAKAPQKIVLSLDLRREEIQVEGWLKGSKKSVFDFFKELRPFAISCLVITDIDRDGMLSGIDLTKTKRMIEEAPFPVIVSGGVGSPDDIQALSNLERQMKEPSKLEGVIIGKALYEGRVELKNALKMACARRASK